MISTAHTIHLCERPSNGGGKCSFTSSSVPRSTATSYTKACRQVGTKPLTALDFRRSVIEDLVHDHLQQCSRPSSGRPRLGPTPIRLNRKLHLLDQRSTFRNCVVCSGQTRHTTCYYCKTCPEQPALHPVPRFERYHTITHYHI